jgi:hypothetical protein
MGARNLICLRVKASVQMELATCKVAEQRKPCQEELVGVNGTDEPMYMRLDFEGTEGSKADCLAGFLVGDLFDEAVSLRYAADCW